MSRKKKRTCSTPGCKGSPTLYPQCDACRKAGCLHKETHIDSVYAVVCSHCGTTVKPSVKKRAKKIVGKGNKAPWQAVPDGLKIPTPSCGVMS